MKLYAPNYYRDFVCIADKCRHSCCVGWEIDVDDDTSQIYQSLQNSYAGAIRDSLDISEGTPHFRLTEGEKCPHLNDCGLCGIILSLGEEYLCEICREHPRFYHDTPRGKEVGLGMACEEACRLILESDNYQGFVEIGELDGDPEASDFDALPHRARLYGILSDRSKPYADRLSEIRNTYGIFPEDLSDNGWRDKLASLEYLNDAHRESFDVYAASATVSAAQEVYLERALAYWIFRHCSAAYDEADFAASLGFALFCERLLASMTASLEEPSWEDFCELARILSEELEYSEDNTEAIKAVFFSE